MRRARVAVMEPARRGSGVEGVEGPGSARSAGVGIALAVARFCARREASRVTQRAAGPSHLPRLRAALALVLAGAAAVGSATGEEGPYEVFTSLPAPYFTPSGGGAVVSWLVTVQASPEAFPPEGDWREVFEVELDVREDGPDLERQLVIGRVARVAPSGRRVLSSTVARVPVGDVGTVILTDAQSFTPCIEGRCEKQYVVQFVLSGLGFFRTRWFLRAGIDWAREDLAPPEAATLNLEIRPL